MARLLLEPRRLPVQIAVGVAAVAAATLLRVAVDDSLPPGFPFLTFFPAVLIAAVFGSLPVGIAAAVASGLIAWVFFIPPRAACRCSRRRWSPWAFTSLSPRPSCSSSR